MFTNRSPLGHDPVLWKALYQAVHSKQTSKVRLQGNHINIIINFVLFLVSIRGGRLLQTYNLIGPEVHISSSCPVRMSHQTNCNALISWYFTMFTNCPLQVWALCTSDGAGLTFEPYCGIDTMIADEGLGQGPNVVLDLVSKSRLPLGSDVFTDNLFTSFPLLNNMSRYCYSIVGVNGYYKLELWLDDR